MSRVATVAIDMPFAKRLRRGFGYPLRAELETLASQLQHPAGAA